MKLKSMSDFVLSISEPDYLEPEEMQESFHMIYSYAKFLKQPLKLEMFVPCGEYGNILYDPELTMRQGNGGVYYGATDEQFEEYQKAKENVLFEGFEPDMFDVKDDGTIILHSKKWKSTWPIGDRTIEDITYLNCELSPSALKTIGI